MSNIKNILICPLDWGLGHAGRMIPVAARLREKDHNVIIGAGDKCLSLFKRELPGLTYIDFPGYSPSYSAFLPQYLKLLLELPLLIYHIIREHKRVRKIINDHSVDILISDNRFGLWNRKITSVYVTHMPGIPFPAPFSFLEFIGICIHRSIIKKYSFCFIPDLPGEMNISGKLSHGIKLTDNVRYIGILSRFSSTEAEQTDTRISGIYNTVILSGPEPQKSIFKDTLTDVLGRNDAKTVFLGGEPSADRSPVISGNSLYFNHLDRSAMKAVIMDSDLIITRSGYTVIMELISLGRSALLVPTPGQTEQEYLADRLSQMGWFNCLSQKELIKGKLLPAGKGGWNSQIMADSSSLLEKALDEMLEQVKK